MSGLESITPRRAWIRCAACCAAAKARARTSSAGDRGGASVAQPTPLFPLGSMRPVRHTGTGDRWPCEVLARRFEPQRCYIIAVITAMMLHRGGCYRAWLGG